MLFLFKKLTHFWAVSIVSQTMLSSGPQAVLIATSYLSSIAPRSPWNRKEKPFWTLKYKIWRRYAEWKWRTKIKLTFPHGTGELLHFPLMPEDFVPYMTWFSLDGRDHLSRWPYLDTAHKTDGSSLLASMTWPRQLRWNHESQASGILTRKDASLSRIVKPYINYGQTRPAEYHGFTDNAVVLMNSPGALS